MRVQVAFEQDRGRLAAPVRADRRAGCGLARRTCRPRADPFGAADGRMPRSSRTGSPSPASGMSQIGRKLMRRPGVAVGGGHQGRGCRRRAHDGRHRRPLDVSGTVRQGGYSEGGITAVESVLGTTADLAQRRHPKRPVPQGRSSPPCSPSRPGCAAMSCASAPSGSRRFGELATTGGVEVPAQGRASGMRRAPGAVRRAGRAHGGDGRLPALRPVRHDARDAGLDRHERQGECRARPDRGVPQAA